MPPPPEDAPVTATHIASGVGTTLMARLGGVVEVVSQPLYVFLFGLASYGLYAVLWAAVNLVENVVDLGMTTAMQRTVPQAGSREEQASALRISLVAGVAPTILIAAIASAGAPWIAPLFHVAPHDQARLVPAIRLFAWALPLWTFVEIATSALRSMRLFGPEIRLRLFWEQVSRVAVAVPLWAMGFGITGLLLAHLASLTIISALSIRMLARYFDLRAMLRGRLLDRIAVETLKAGLASLPTNVVQQIFTDAPPLVLNILLPGAGGAKAAALYGISRKIASVIQLFRTAFAYVLAPLASAATRQGHAQLQGLYAYTTRLIAASVIPMTALMAVAAPALLRLFSREALVALPALLILFLARMIEAMSGAAKPLQQVVGGYARQLTSSFVGLGLTIAIGIVSVPALGLTGMSIAVGVGLVAAAVIPMAQLNRHEKLHPFAPPFARVVATAACVAAACALPGFAVRLLPGEAQLPLLVPLLLAGVWLSMRLALPEEDRGTLGKLGKRLRLTA